MNLKNIYLLSIILLFLTACTGETIKQPEESIEIPEEKEIQELAQPSSDLLFKYSIQRKNGEKIGYGFSRTGKILEIGRTKFYYSNDLLELVKGKKQIKLIYENNSVQKIGDIELLRDSNNRITRISTPDERWKIVYDSKNLPRKLFLFNTETNLDYDKKNNLNYITRGMHTIDVHYNERNLPDDFDAGNQNHLIMGYRGDKIAMLSGKLFGTAFTIDYSTDGLSATILNPEDNSKFSAIDKLSLQRTLDLYVYCTQIKTIPYIFDAKSYAFFRAYFSENFEDYLVMNLYCEAVKDAQT